MAIPFNDNIRANVNRPLDLKFGPFISIVEAKTVIPIEQRYHGLTFGVYTVPGDLPNTDILFYYFLKDLEETKLLHGDITILGDDLYTLQQTNNLVVGQWYLMSDFATKHLIPNTITIHTGDFEPLRLIAIAPDQFSNKVESTVYPNDLIYFDITDRICENGTTPRKGKIIFRFEPETDTYTYYDFREVVFRRWKITEKQEETITSLTPTTFDCTLTFSTNLSGTAFSNNRRIQVQVGAITHDAGELTLTIQKGAFSFTKPLLKYDGSTWTANELANTSGIITNCIVRNAFIYMNYKVAGFAKEVEGTYSSPISTTYNLGDGLSYLVDDEDFEDYNTFESTYFGVHIDKFDNAQIGNNIVFLNTVDHAHFGQECHTNIFRGPVFNLVSGHQIYGNVFAGDVKWSTFRKELVSCYFAIGFNHCNINEHVISNTFYTPQYGFIIDFQVTNSTISFNGSFVQINNLIENSSIFLNGTFGSSGRGSTIFSSIISNSLVGYFNADNLILNKRLSATSFYKVPIVTNHVRSLNIGESPSSVGDVNILGWDSEGNVIKTTLEFITSAELEAALEDVIAGETYQGTWDASTNTPTLTSSTGTEGFYYQVSVAGSTTLDGISSWALGDEAVFNGTVWIKRASLGIKTINSKSGNNVTLNQDEVPDGVTYKQYSLTEKTKLSGIETGADVTDAVNIGTSIHGATAKTTPVDADTIPLIDSAASNVLKKVTWANIKATLVTYFNTLYNLYTHPNHTGDVTSSGDGITTITNGIVTETKLSSSVNASLDLADSASQPGHTHSISDITEFADEVNELINTSDLEARVDVTEYYHSNLAIIDKFEERCNFNSRILFRKLIHTEDVVVATDNVHFIPSYKDDALLPSIHPNLYNADLVVNSIAGYNYARPLDGDTARSFIVSPANSPKEYYNFTTGRVEGILNEDVKYIGLYSGDFSQLSGSGGPWVLDEATRDVSAVASPLPGRFYSRLYENAVSGSHRIRQNTVVVGNDTVGVWATCLTYKTGNARNIGINVVNSGGTSITVRAIFNPTTGVFDRLEDGTNAALLIASEVIDLGDSWYFGILVDTDTTGFIRYELSLRSGTSFSSYAGNIANFIYADAFNCIQVKNLVDPMPLPNITTSALVDTFGDTIELVDWVGKGYMGAYSGQVVSKMWNDTIIEEWAGNQLTITTNDVAASPITSAIPTDYPLRKGLIKSVRIKRISDDVPDIPSDIDFDTVWGFASLYHPSAARGTAGFTGVTGGNGSINVYEVSTEADFETAWERTDKTDRIIRIMTNITLNNEVYTNVTGNWTLESLNGSALIGGELRIDGNSNWNGLGARNWKIRNIKRRGPVGATGVGDLLALQNNVTDWWVDHVEFDGEFNQVLDGIFDAKRGIDYGTISFCKFKDHNQDIGGEGKVSLFGLSFGQSNQTATQTQNDDGKFHMTLYGNEYDNNYQRQHRVVYGKWDQACCYYHNNNRCWDIYGGEAYGPSPSGTTVGGEVIVRHSYFENNTTVRLNNGGKIRFDDCVIVSSGSTGNLGTMTWNPDTFYTNLELVSGADSKQFVLDYSGAILHTL